jgi:hypothetical protein
MRDVKIGLRVSQRPASVYTAPDRNHLTPDYYDGVAWVTVPEVREHAMIIFEP